MNTVLKLLLSVSLSGGLMILALLLGKQLWRNRLGRQWQYYIWLAVIVRLLLPFAPKVTLLGEAYRTLDNALYEPAVLRLQSFYARRESRPETASQGEKPQSAPEEVSVESPPGKSADFSGYVWLLWPAVGFAVLICRVTAYRSFIRYVKAGAAPVSDMKMLDRLADAAKQTGVKRPVELLVNPLVASPLLTGFFRPCIVLPCAQLSEESFRYVAMHELIHFRRRDMIYKWLVQLAVCVHWFNPLVWVMSREITKACELSCDEAVLEAAGAESAADYGRTLLDAMAAAGRYRKNAGSVALGGSKQLLKERLGAIMNYRKKSAAVRFLTAVLTVCVILGAAFVGVYPVSAKDGEAAGTKAAASAKKPVKVKFKGISVTGEGPVGLEIVRTDRAQVSFDYRNMDSPKKCLSTQKTENGMMYITVKNTAEECENISFGDQPRNVVRIYVPDAEYEKFDISLDRAVLYMQDFRAGVHVRAKEGGVSLVDTDISRGSYVIDIDNGPLAIEAGRINGDIEADVDSGPITLTFLEYPNNLYLDTTGCGPYPVELPEGWASVCRIGNETPRIILNNYGPLFVSVEEQKAGETHRDEDDWDEGDWDWNWDEDDWDWDWDEDDWDWDWDWDEDDWNWDDQDKDDGDKDDWEWSEYEYLGIVEADGKLYYKGDLVRVFLDRRPVSDGRCWRMHINPKGKVNIQVVRDKDRNITGVEYMTKEEMAELMGKM